MRRLPELVGDNLTLRQLHDDQLLGRPVVLCLRPPPVGLLGAIPDEAAPVELVVQHLADGGRGPALAAAPSSKLF